MRQLATAERPEPNEFRLVRTDMRVLDFSLGLLGDEQPTLLDGSDGFGSREIADRPHPWAVASDAALARAVRAATDLHRVPGVGDVRAESLREHGFTSLLDIARATPERLTRISGIGPIRASRIHRSALELLETDRDAFEL